MMNDNNEVQFLLVYEGNTMMSHYLSKLLDGPGGYIRKKIINRDFIIDTIGKYNVIYSIDTDIEGIVRILRTECLSDEIVSFNNDEPLTDTPSNIDQTGG